MDCLVVGAGAIAFVLLKSVALVRKCEFIHVPVARDFGDDRCQRDHRYSLVPFYERFLLPFGRDREPGVEKYLHAIGRDRERAERAGSRFAGRIADTDTIYRLCFDKRVGMTQCSVSSDVFIEYLALLRGELFGISEFWSASLGDECKYLAPLEDLWHQYDPDADRPGKCAATRFVDAYLVPHRVSISPGMEPS